MNDMITPIHHKIVTLRGKQIMLNSDLAEIFKILDILVFETKKTDEKVMGFLKL